MPRYAVLMAAVALIAGGARAVDVPTAQLSSVQDLGSLLEGEFTTAPAAADVGAAPSGGRVLYDLSKQVIVPALGHNVVYSELREGAPDGKLVWQRLYALKLDSDTGLIIMTPYSFANTAALAGAATDPKPLAELKPADLKQQQGGCVIAWRRAEDGFAGSPMSGSCQSATADRDSATEPAISITKTTLSERLEIAGDAPVTFRRLR